ncbi:MAG: right-handed parallel beta-helix repeat-containing protein, partial [Deltaproteobacteria bacterium]|nr:right-handed parallel beta-helix repeat-containing protein [Deltaproteobacteria bacterium]
CPMTIGRGQPSSYKLTSNLVNLDPDVSSVVIEDSHVTLDLNGFAISGPPVCTGAGAGLSCLPAGSGFGIQAFTESTGIVVKNGVVRGSPLSGIEMLGNTNRVEGVHVVSNAGIGNQLGQFGVVERCRALRNQSGILVTVQGLARGNVVAGKKSIGLDIGLSGGAAHANVVRGNSLAFFSDSFADGVIADNAITDNSNAVPLGGDEGYARPVFRGNGGTGTQLTGGVEIGTNLCGADTNCP